MFSCGTGRPGLDGGRFHLFGLATVAAQQVVVMSCDRAAPVNGLAVAVPKDINEAVVSQGLQDPICRGQRHGDAFVLQQPVELLGADKVIQFVQGGADSQALLGDPLLLDAAGGRRCVAGRGGIGALWH